MTQASAAITGPTLAVGLVHQLMCVVWWALSFVALIKKIEEELAELSN